MASGLPCIVVDHAGLGEYVTAETGFKIKPRSREYVIEKVAKKIMTFYQNRRLIEKMSQKAIERVKEFEWGAKADRMVDIYRKMTAGMKV